MPVQFARCGGFPQDDGGSLHDSEGEVDDLLVVHGGQETLQVGQSQWYQPDGGTLHSHLADSNNKDNNRLIISFAEKCSSESKPESPPGKYWVRT